MTQKEFTELTKLPEAQYEDGNASYIASDMEKHEWAKEYLKVKDSKLYNELLDFYYYEKNLRTAKQVEIDRLNNERNGIAMFLADQAEKKQSLTLDSKARELMGEKELLIYKLQNDYILNEDDKKKIAEMLIHGEKITFYQK